MSLEAIMFICYGYIIVGFFFGIIRLASEKGIVVTIANIIKNGNKARIDFMGNTYLGTNCLIVPVTLYMLHIMFWPLIMIHAMFTEW